MKKILYGVFLIGLSSLFCDQFTNSTMFFYGHWKQYSQWGVWARVNKPPLQWLSVNPTYEYVPLVIQGYSTTAEENAILQKQPSGGLKPDMFRDNPSTVGLAPESAGYAPVNVTIISPFRVLKTGCNLTQQAPKYGWAPYGKCYDYYMFIDPYALIDNLTPYLGVETFAMLPCEPCGSTDSNNSRPFIAKIMTNLFGDNYSWANLFPGQWIDAGGATFSSNIEAGFFCMGEYPTFNGGTPQGGWHAIDTTVQGKANRFMRFGAALMLPSMQNGQPVSNQNYLTVQSVNQVAANIFANLNYTSLFNSSIFELYFSNDDSLMQNISSFQTQW